MGRFFSPAVLASSSPQVQQRAVRWCRRILGYAGCCAAIRDMDHTTLLSKIHVPTLVISGDLDVGMPWKGHAAVLASVIEGARAVRLPAAHISNLERPRSFSAALLDFLVPRPAETRDAGFATRRAVLGDDHVDRAIAGTTDFTRDFQELITNYAWGSIWTRPGLDPVRAGCWCSPLPPPWAAGRSFACTSAPASPTSWNPVISRKCCCSWRCTPVFRLPTPRSTSRPKCSTRSPTDIPESIAPDGAVSGIRLPSAIFDRWN